MITFQVICPVRKGKAEGTAYVWSGTPERAQLAALPCSAISARAKKLADNIPILEKQFGLLADDPHERAKAIYEIMAFRNLIECVRHGNSAGWDRYILHLVNRDYSGAKEWAVNNGRFEPFTEQDKEQIAARENEWLKNFPTVQHLSGMLWNLEAAAGLSFVMWQDSRTDTRPAIYAPNLKMAIMAFCLAQMEYPAAAWALCPVCGKEFERERRNKLYDTDKCKNIAGQQKFRERHKSSATKERKHA